MRAVTVCLALASVAGACAARKPVAHDSQVADRAVAAGESLEVFMGKVRARSEHLAPASVRADAIETRDPRLAHALIELAAHQTPQAHKAVAQEYLRLGVLDLAHEHLSAVVARDPKDAAAWDALARIWRSWNLPHLALPDAYRAVYFAPNSPVVHNTLGTVLQALGHAAEARRQYQRAIELDPAAAYAWSNLCSAWMLDNDASRAINACRRAIDLDEGLEPARNNLALAYEAQGNHAAAVAVLASGDPSRAAFNTGVLSLARRQYADALKAFEEAQALRPRFRAAALMARQARERLQEENHQ